MTLSWMTPVNNYGGFAFAIHKTRYSAANLLANQKFTLSVPTAQSRDLVLSVGRVSGKVVKKFDGSIPHLTAGTFGYLGPVSSNDISADISSSKNKNKNGFDALYDSDIEEQEDGEEEEASLKIKSTNKAARTSCQIQHIFPPPIDGTIAHMNCTVLSHTDAADAGTYLVIANIHRASVHADYWSSKGKCFISAGVERNSRLSTHLTVPALLAMGNDDTEEPGPVTLPLPPILSFLGSQRFGHLVAEWLVCTGYKIIIIFGKLSVFCDASKHRWLVRFCYYSILKMLGNWRWSQLTLSKHTSNLHPLDAPATFKLLIWS